MIITIDPTKGFKHAPLKALYEVMGLLPYITLAGFDNGVGDTVAAVYKGMVTAYGFGDMSYKGGSVDEEGVYRYPEDPPLAPVARFEREGTPVKVYIYQYALICVTDGENAIFSRMD